MIVCAPDGCMDYQLFSWHRSLFANDLFRCILCKCKEVEVPLVNKPRRACSYFLTALFIEELSEIYIFSALFSYSIV